MSLVHPDAVERTLTRLSETVHAAAEEYRKGEIDCAVSILESAESVARLARHLILKEQEGE